MNYRQPREEAGREEGAASPSHIEQFPAPGPCCRAPLEQARPPAFCAWRTSCLDPTTGRQCWSSMPPTTGGRTTPAERCLTGLSSVAYGREAVQQGGMQAGFAGRLASWLNGVAAW